MHLNIEDASLTKKSISLSHIAVSAEQGQVSWSLQGVQPKPKLKALLAEDR